MLQRSGMQARITLTVLSNDTLFWPQSPAPAPTSAWSPSWRQSSFWLKHSFFNHGPLFCAQLQIPTSMQSYDWRNVFEMKNNLFHLLSLFQLLIPTPIPVLELWLILFSFFFFLNHIIFLSPSLHFLPLLFQVLLTAVDPHSSFQSPLLPSLLSSLPQLTEIFQRKVIQLHPGFMILPLLLSALLLTCCLWEEWGPRHPGTRLFNEAPCKRASSSAPNWPYGPQWALAEGCEDPLLKSNFAGNTWAFQSDAVEVQNKHLQAHSAWCPPAWWPHAKCLKSG